jgi:pentapeptide repeat protein
MANPKHLAMLKKGVAVWNRWKEKGPKLGWGLREADLSEANLRKIKLEGANLSRTLFTRSRLDGADLRGANLFSADLREALVTGANLSSALLTRLSQLRGFFGFFVMIFVFKSCVFIRGI